MSYSMHSFGASGGNKWWPLWIQTAMIPRPTNVCAGVPQYEWVGWVWGDNRVHEYLDAHPAPQWSYKPCNRGFFVR